LQAEDPSLQIIACWQAPKTVENYLHKLFASKRVRGEWFDLNHDDLQRIKNEMEKYKR
jgi:hypothetical protein